jgi:hypothetical protein
MINQFPPQAAPLTFGKPPAAAQQAAQTTFGLPGGGGFGGGAPANPVAAPAVTNWLTPGLTAPAAPAVNTVAPPAGKTASFGFNQPQATGTTSNFGTQVKNANFGQKDKRETTQNTIFKDLDPEHQKEITQILDKFKDPMRSGLDALHREDMTKELEVKPFHSSNKIEPT